MFPSQGVLRKASWSLVLIAAWLGFAAMRVSAVLVAVEPQLQLPDEYQARIEASLAAAIRHGGEAILTPAGYSRCDYEMISGEWQEYETMWHTGQLIQGLLAAYRVTGRSEALRHARRAGDWWVSQTFPEDHP
ncbi:MAG: hypothetical protein D6772_06685, partial [Bacteroidetes bacterium]